MSTHAPTPADLAAHLLGAPGSKARFGRNAEEVLGTAKLIQAASNSWSKETLRSFLTKQKLNSQVWDKLLGIAKSENIKAIPEGMLPASYTALYALVVMNEDELAAALQQDVVSADASSRFILDWTKAYRLQKTGVTKEIPLTLVLHKVLTPAEQEQLLDAFAEIAEDFDADILQGKGGVRQADLKAEQRKARAEAIEQELMREIGTVVTDAPDDLKTRFGIRSAADLMACSFSRFTGFLQVLENKENETFWRKHGRAYLLRLAYEFNVTDSRAERYQLKKRLMDKTEYWGSQQGIEGLVTTGEEILKTFMSK